MVRSHVVMEHIALHHVTAMWVSFPPVVGCFLCWRYLNAAGYRSQPLDRPYFRN